MCQVSENREWLTGHTAVSHQSIQLHSRFRGALGVPPSLEIVCGTDDAGTGIAVVAYTPSGGAHRRVGHLLSVRWQNPSESVEELVRVVIAGLRAVQLDRGWPQE